ncbi:MAG: serine hydrolase domain-containing protein [Vicinamibacterales bacterium]
MGPLDRARSVVERAIANRVFPAAALEVGSSTGPLWRDALGTLTFDAGASRTAIDTPFDLASLTKVIATTTVVMDLVRAGRLSLDQAIVSHFQEWRGVDRDSVTVRDLLEHAAGLAARLVDAPPTGRREFEHDICRMPLEYAPRSRSIYSDLGFILLGFLSADTGGASLAELFGRLQPDAPGHGATPDATDEGLTFELPEAARRRAAPTLPLGDDPRRGRSLVGEVHDQYAAALGGVAGHAGLFGNAPAVGRFARGVLAASRGGRAAPPPFSPETVALFTTQSTVPRSSRALGWDRMLVTSSCGTRMSARAFGHTGFTGTSLWIDPGRDRYFVLLTNRACRGASPEEMQGVRRAFHDALGEF